jgi:hypothetical protein
MIGQLLAEFGVYMPFDNLIIEITRKLIQDCSYQRVFPWMVAENCQLSVSERTIRRYMARMACDGQLRRLGPRYGYTVE